MGALSSTSIIGSRIAGPPAISVLKVTDTDTDKDKDTDRDTATSALLSPYTES
jgi:hypothetical protein